MEPSAVNAEFSMHGLTLRSDAMRDVCDFLQRQADAGEALSLLLAALQSSQLASSVVHGAAVREAMAKLAGAADVPAAGAAPAGGLAACASSGPLQVVNAFAVPRVLYDPVRRAFHSAPASPSVLATADAKVSLYRERFHLVSQRLLRNKLFSRPALGAGAGGGANGVCELTPLQALLGTAGSTRFVLGALSALDDGRYWLEDATGAVAVDLSRAATAAGLFTENCVVVAEGSLRRDGVFEVCALGFPPPERREDSVAALNGLDLFGAGSVRAADAPALGAAAAACADEMWVVLADVFLDAPGVLANLARVLGAFEAADAPPTLFVLMGDFCTTPFGAGAASVAAAREAFESLAKLLRRHPRLLQQSRFMLMPGPGDPGASPALPRPALPRSLTRAVREVAPSAIFASSPCRIRCHAHDVVLFREDLAVRMRSACVRPPADGASGDDAAPPGERLFAHLTATLLQQSHLAPLPLPHAPVHWAHDHALWLYPAPHALLLADRTAPQAAAPFEDTVCFNPGSFGTDGSFAVYRPATRVAELSGV